MSIFLDVAVTNIVTTCYQTYSHTGFLASHIVCIQSVRCNLCLRRPHVSLSVWKNDYGFWMFLTQPLHSAKFSSFVQEQQCYIFRLLLGQLNCSRERESFGKRGVKPDIFWPSLTSNCCCHLHDSHWVKLPLSHHYIVSGWVHIQSCFVMFLQDMLRKNRPSQLSEIIAAGFVTNTVCDGRWTVTVTSICSSLRSLEFWFRLCCWPCEFGANHPNS